MLPFYSIKFQNAAAAIGNNNISVRELIDFPILLHSPVFFWRIFHFWEYTHFGAELILAKSIANQ
ncbi:MAG: hypothetical protein R3C41_06575 [Calditrichia bacterium]|nr:hypothetical protein [Calditrichota bacterium]